MILEMSTETYTLIHVVISLGGIASGFVVLWGMLGSRRLDGWNALFLVTTVATSMSGFGFPFDHLLPSHRVGILSLAVLALAIVARYPLHLMGPWRWIYVVTAMIAQYFNVFVLVVQSFEKVPVLRAIAPTQSEPPFAIAQGIVLVLFILAIILAVRKFRPEPSGAV